MKLLHLINWGHTTDGSVCSNLEVSNLFFTTKAKGPLATSLEKPLKESLESQEPTPYHQRRNES